MFYSKKDLDNELNYVKNAAENISNNVIKGRIINIIEWYIRGAYYQRGRYFAATIAATACNTIIPIIVLVNKPDFVDVFIAILSATSGFFLALSAHYKWHSNWLNNRRNAELIKSSLVLYLTKSEPYDLNNADTVFISELERMVIMEGNNWFVSRAKDKENRT